MRRRSAPLDVVYQVRSQAGALTAPATGRRSWIRPMLTVQRSSPRMKALVPSSRSPRQRVGPHIDQRHLARIDGLLAGLLEVHRDLGADHRLDLAQAPVSLLRMAHQGAGLDEAVDHLFTLLWPLWPEHPFRQRAFAKGFSR